MSTQASAVSACAHAAAPSGAAAPAASELAPASSATTNQAPSPPEPQRVLLRVRGTSMQYTPLLFSWHDLGAMSGLQLLDELARSVLFGSRFRDVCFLDACVVSIFKGPQPSGSRSPTADEDLDDANFVDVQSDEPVRAAAARAGVGKGTMFILVRPAREYHAHESPHATARAWRCFIALASRCITGSCCFAAAYVSLQLCC